jgi:iron complex outermembrane receptor protein
VIRGLSGNRVLTYVQGVRLENQQFGSEHGLGINEAGIESVEVIKGPASLLYGSDALGGVLYFNPESFAASGNLSADASTSYFSNTLGVSGNAGVKTSGERFKFLLRGAYASQADYKTGDDKRVTNSRYNEYDLKSGLRFQNSTWKSTIRYNYNRANIGIPEAIEAQTTSRNLLLPFQELDNHILSWANTLFFGKSSADVKFGYIFNDRREFEDSTNEAALRLKLNTFSYDLKYNLPEIGKFETIVGVQGMFQKNKNFGEEILIPNTEKIDFGIFATSHYHLDKVDFQGGLRLDTRSITTEPARDPMDFNFIPALDRNFTSFNAALGAKVDISQSLLTRINVASGFRAPNLAELTSNGVHEGSNRYEIGDPGLDNEQNLQTDVSLEYRNEHFEIFANGFYNAVNNYIYITPTGAVLEENFVFSYVQNNAELYGGEFSFHLHPHPLDWLHFESSFETVTGKLKEGGNLALIPANNLRNTLHFDLKEGVLLKESSAFMTLQNTFDQNKVGEYETRSKGYDLLSLGVKSQLEWDKITCRLAFSITNLTNETYVPHLSRLKVDHIPSIGRNYSVNVKLALN